jgi:ribose transport system permease protein
MRIRSDMVQRLLPFISLIALFVGLSIASPNFLTATNLSSVVRQTATISIMALGMTLVIVSGGIDLSVGAILAFAGTLGTMAIVAGAPVWGGVAVGVLCGLFWGFVNALLATSLKIPPFIVTLGTLGIVRGVTLII